MAPVIHGDGISNGLTTPCNTKTQLTSMETIVINEVDPDIVNLVEQSVAARRKAYAPYSNFLVGAALRCTDGTIVKGCNVENISYGLSFCAERTAIVKAVSEGKTSFDAIAVCGIMEDKTVTPCGACRQFLAEFNPRMLIYMHNPKTENVVCTTLDFLLPESFNPEVAKF